MISKFKKHRRTIRPPFNAENMFLLGTVRMMFWRRSLRQKIVKHKRGSRSRRGQQHAVALAKEKSAPLDKVEFETRLHHQDGVFSDPHPMFAGIAAEVHGTSEEMRVDSSASYRSTGASVGATSQNSTDVVIEEMRAQLEWREAQLHEQKKVGERLQKIIDEQKKEHEQLYQERVELIAEYEFKEKFNKFFIENWKRVELVAGYESKRIMNKKEEVNDYESDSEE